MIYVERGVWLKKKLNFFLETIKEHLKEECLGLFFSLLYTGTFFVSPQISKFLIDEVLVNHRFQDIGVAFLAFFLVCVVQTVSAYLKDKVFFKISEKITFSMRTRMLKNLIYADMDFFDVTPKGFIFSRFFNDIRSVSNFITNIFVTVIKNSLLIVALTCGMFIISWKISLAVFIILLAYVLLNILSSNKFKKFSQLSLQKNDALYVNFGQSIDNAFLIRTFNLYGYYFEKIKNNLKNLFKLNIKLNNFSNIIRSCSDITVIASLAIIYGYGAFLNIKNEVSVGDIVAMGVYFQMLLGPVSELTSSNTLFQEIFPVVERIEEYLQLIPNFDEKDNKKLLSDGSPLTVSFVNVYFGKKVTDKNTNILKNINFVFEGIGKYGLFGVSGSGKSTILKLLMGLYPVTNGDIRIYSEDDKMSFFPNQISNRVSYVSQRLELINASVFDNLTLFDSTITEEDVVGLCKFLHLHKKIMSLDSGYASIIDENINLSEGEKQRICIARAVLKKSFIYIFDEPTAFLDEEIQAQVKSIIGELSGKKMVIVVSHDVSLFDKCKKIIIINNGEIVKECNEQEFINYIE